MIDQNYNYWLQQPWIDAGFDVVYQACCLQIPEHDDAQWQIQYPQHELTDNTVILMHCQDFLNVDADACRELDLMQQYFGNRCDRVVAVTWNKHLENFYTGPIQLAHFPTHSFEILTNLHRNQSTWMPQLEGRRHHVWQCLNGVPKKHRIRAVAALQGLDNGIVSLNPDLPIPDWPYYPCYQTCSNEDNFLRLMPIYANCDINIVTETMYNHRPGIITEKTIMAFLALQVPLLIGHPGIVADVQSIGFDVFEDVLDLSYDWLENDQRVEAAVNLNRSVLLNGIDRESLLPRLRRNQQLALEWPRVMIADYQQRVQQIQACMRGT